MLILRGALHVSVVAVLLAWLSAALAGCGERQQTRAQADLAQEARVVLGGERPRMGERDSELRDGLRAQDRRGTGAAAAEGQSGGDWTIVLTALRGEQERARAESVLRRIRTEGNLPEAYMQQRGPSLVIVYGRYSGPDSPRAQRDLDRIRTMQIGEDYPYIFAFLSPPQETARPGSRPEYNLVSARQTYGPSALYTLQVGVYGRDDLTNPSEADLAESRARAEEAVAILRQEGELAFYYHGRFRSMVTVGVFDGSDFDPQRPQFQSQRLRDTRERHPHNLYNGRAVRERMPDGTRRLQASRLVVIPER